MKNTLVRITLAALAVVLLGSCEKINQRIDALEERIDGIETEKIASIDSQIASINSSIADLGTIRSNITSLRSQVDDHSTDIFNLEEADRALNDRILNLEDYLDDVLPTYAEKDWVKATFSTLAQYEATCDTIAKIDARIGRLDERLSKEIKACADSMKKWVNVQFEAYYTAAEMDAALEYMQAEIDSAKVSGKITDERVDSLANELTKTKAAVDSAKAQLTREYKAAIDTAITHCEGRLTKALTDAITKVNDDITALTTRVSNLEVSVATLTGRVTALEKMIQTVTIVPAYTDGSVKVEDDTLYLDCIISPTSAVSTLTKANFTVLVNEVLTKAVDVKTISITEDKWFSKNVQNGTVSLKVPVKNYIPASADSSLTAAVNVQNGISDFTTEFVPVYVDPRTFKAVYNTNGDANTLTFYYDAVDHSGEGITVYEDGTDKSLFDDTKTYGAKWGYNDKRGEIKSVVIDASVAGYEGLTSTTFMFQGMTKATGIFGAEYLDVSNVTDMSLMFMNFGGGNTNSHTTLNSVPDVSGWDTGKVTNMAGMFNSYGNFSDNLAIVPDVSNWNTANVTNMSSMFQKYGHESQTFNAVPDVSKWNTGNVTNMANMFNEYGHKSTALNTVPDVSKWNTAKVENMNAMFKGFAYSSTVLDVVPDVSKWDTGNVTNMAEMFNGHGYKSTVLNAVPDVSKWKTDSVEIMTNMFQNYGYSSTVLSTVPNVSSWKTSNVTKIGSMFQSYGYSSTALSTVPDVSKWDTGKMENISSMFQSYGYSSTALSTVPDVSKWETDKLQDISNMFQNYGYTSQSIINCTLDLSGWNLSIITNAVSVFNFNPKTFDVTIPAKTGTKANAADKWYFGDGTDYIVPPTGKTFTPALAGVFSVSATKKVHFSQGNLQATYNSSASTYTWGFAANQYSRIGNAAGNTTIDTQTDGAVVDLFGWVGASSTTFTSSPKIYGVSTSQTASDYGNVAVEALKADWGTAIDDKGTWRTLSNGEWKYLFNNHSKKWATVNGVKGYVIAPDGFAGTLSDTYADDAALAANNLVFLPATGCRNGSGVGYVDEGYYWSSTAYGESEAYSVNFDNSSVNPGSYDFRNYGFSVRLVTEVK